MSEKKKDLEHVLLEFWVVIKKRAKNMLEGGAALSVSHMQRRYAMRAAICSVPALSLFLIPTF